MIENDYYYYELTVFEQVAHSSRFEINRSKYLIKSIDQISHRNQLSTISHAMC